MHPMFWFFVICAAVIIWAALCILFKPLGKMMKHVVKTVEKNMEEDEHE